MMWRAKHINFDTGTGFSVENLFGAGVPETLAHLRAHGHAEIAEKLEHRYVDEHLFADLEGWSRQQEYYFYARRLGRG